MIAWVSVDSVLQFLVQDGSHEVLHLVHIVYSFLIDNWRALSCVNCRCCIFLFIFQWISQKREVLCWVLLFQWIFQLCSLVQWLPIRSLFYLLIGGLRLNDIMLMDYLSQVSHRLCGPINCQWLIKCCCGLSLLMVFCPCGTLSAVSVHIWQVIENVSRVAHVTLFALFDVRSVFSHDTCISTDLNVFNSFCLAVSRWLECLFHSIVLGCEGYIAIFSKG